MSNKSIFQRMLRALRERVDLAPLHRWLLYGATALIWLTGGLWLLLRDPSGNTPWPPLLMKIHGALAMLFLLLLGSLTVHVLKGLVMKKNLAAGLSLLATALFLVVTGWMLYYLGDDYLRNLTSLAHWLVGLALPLLMLIHIVLGRGSKNKQKHKERH